jgi:hypothetical protein
MNQSLIIVLMSFFYLLPVICFITLILAIKQSHINYALTALWLSLIAVILNYQLAGDEIIGDYFNIFNATIYTVNLLLFVFSTLYVLHLLNSTLEKKLTKILMPILSLFLVIGCGIVLTNLWINARFLHFRHPKTPIIKVDNLNSPTHCNYKYVFLKINNDAKVNYLCPNGHGIIAATGELPTTPKLVKSLIGDLHGNLINELGKKNPQWLLN